MQGILQEAAALPDPDSTGEGQPQLPLLPQTLSTHRPAATAGGLSSCLAPARMGIRMAMLHRATAAPSLLAGVHQPTSQQLCVRINLPIICFLKEMRFV